MYYGGGIVGYDKDGDPILLDPAGHRDWKGIIDCYFIIPCSLLIRLGLSPT